MAVQIRSLEPGAIDAEAAARAVRRIKDYLMRHPEEETIPVAGETGDDEALVLPRPAVSLFAYILAQAAEGKGISVIPSRAELTTQQAADLLNVSRPFLIGLLESGTIPYRMVGRHRRITAEDVMEYKRRDDRDRRAAADDLSALGQDLGL
ncbi:helix-turn-helix domain-containing protein [Actinomadura sp. BRA 177]|uniref:helix-turn-helix domain-containing protein n=1 Tax=Actinomadura sp. BRA 177 TaxID=2745202 RepID=UPI001595711D|nr:helix-turn-helix domain-containing protein [Actinomadura sp. BRA 177]NVI85960.1 helix-turn-helix domain-containing protein [Actinomadura sp. BRA 177]